MSNNAFKDFATKVFNMYANHPFGKETTVAEIVTRIAFETEAAGIMRDKGNIAMADAHEQARAAYLALLVRAEETIAQRSRELSDKRRKVSESIKEVEYDIRRLNLQLLELNFQLTEIDAQFKTFPEYCKTEDEE